MKLLKTFKFIDPMGREWVAPEGAIIDGASIPQVAWSFIGGPFEGVYRDASVIHDVACDQRSRPWKVVHEAFYDAMITSGVSPLKAKVMYGAVYHYGPRWIVGSSKAASSSATAMTEQEFIRLKAAIEANERGGAGMTLQQIRDLGP
jgi:Protein of unknown function (DUF1353)